MGKKQGRTFWAKRRSVLIGALLVVVLVLGAGVAYMLFSRQTATEGDASQAKQKETEQRTKQAEDDGKLQADAAKQISSNKGGEAEKLYQQAVDAADGQERKTQLFIDLSAVYYKEKQIDQAIAVAKKAEQQNPDKFLIADWLSRIYEDQKNYKEAEKYYRMAAASAGSPQNKTALDKAYFEDEADRVAKLGGGK